MRSMKPRRFTLQWWVQQAFWTVTGAMVVLALYIPQSLIGPV